MRLHIRLSFNRAMFLVGNLLLVAAIVSCKPYKSTDIAAQPEKQKEQASATTFMPKRVPFSESLMNQLKLPEGFKVNVFTSGLTNPRMMAVNNKIIYVTQPKANNVV